MSDPTVEIVPNKVVPRTRGPRARKGPVELDTVGRRIAAARVLKGLTQKQLAERISKKKATVIQYEQGRLNPPIPVIQGIAKALDVQPEFIAFGQQGPDNHQRIAMLIAYNCVRNSPLEDFHAGIAVQTKTGDYSDVKVVTPHGEIPWNEVSHISDEEMKHLMMRITDAIYTATIDPRFLRPVPEYWNIPKKIPFDEPEDSS